MDASFLSDEQKLELIHNLDVPFLRSQRANRQLFGDCLSLILAFLVAISDKNAIFIHSLFGAAHYSARNQDGDVLARNHIKGPPYRNDWEYLIIPVIMYPNPTMTNKQMEDTIGHWVIAIYIRQNNRLVYFDPYGRENIAHIPQHVKRIIYNAINTVGPDITNLIPQYFRHPHNNQPENNSVDCGYYCIFFIFRFLLYGLNQIEAPNLNMFAFKNNVIKTLQDLTDINVTPIIPPSNNDFVQILPPPKANKLAQSLATNSEQMKLKQEQKLIALNITNVKETIPVKKSKFKTSIAPSSDDDDITILSPPKAKKDEIDISFLPNAYHPSSPKKKASKNPKIPKPKPEPIKLISSKKGRPPKGIYIPRTSDSEANTVATNPSEKSKQMKSKNEQEIITVDSSSDEEKIPLKKSKTADTPTAPFNALSLTTPKSEKSNFNDSATPKRPNNRKSLVGNKRGKGESTVTNDITMIDLSNDEVPMEVDRKILTPKKVVVPKKIKPLSPKIDLNDSIISDNIGASPATTDNEADDEISFIEVRTNVKALGFEAVNKDLECSYITVTNRYNSNPRMKMTIETTDKKTVLHQMPVSPRKKSKNAKVLKVSKESQKTGAKIEIEKIIPPKKGESGSKFILKKTEEADLNSSDSSASNKGRFTKKFQRNNNGRFSKKSAAEDSETESEPKSNKKASKDNIYKVVDESTQIVLFDQKLTDSQKLMPPPNIFKVFEKATGEKMEKVQSPKAKNESDKEVAMEIDTTKSEIINESDSATINSDAPQKKRRGRPPKKVVNQQVTVTKMEIENSDTSVVNTESLPKKGRGRPKEKNSLAKNEIKSENSASETEPKNKGGRPIKNKKGGGRPKKDVQQQVTTVIESENNADSSFVDSQEKGGRPLKKKGQNQYTKGTAIPKPKPEPSKFPKLTPYPPNARCHYDNFKHKEGCAAYSVNHKVEYKDHGDFVYPCKHCGAYLNAYERDTPSAANKCCNNGELNTDELILIQDILDDAPDFMQRLIDKDYPEINKSFMKNSHKYNQPLAFGTVQTVGTLPPLPGHGPPVIRMNGNYQHVASGFFPPKGKKAAFGQLYCIDFNEAEEIVGEKAKQQKLCDSIAQELLKMINENHVFAPLMKTAAEKFAEAIKEAKEQKNEMPKFKLMIVDSRDEDFKISDPSIHPHRAEKPRNELIGMIWTNDNGEPPEFKGVWLTGKEGETKYFPYYSPNVDPLCYPLLFPRGNQIYHNGMLLKSSENELKDKKLKKKNIMEDDTDVSEAEVERHINGDDDDDYVDEDILEEDPSKKRKKIIGRKYASRKQVTRFFLYPRSKHRLAFQAPHWLWSRGPIADAWLIDMVCRAERSQLDVARKKVENMKNRCTTSNELKKHIEKKYLNNKKLGALFTIPSHYKGGRKYMQNAYADIMTIIDNTKLPSYFVTFTGNPQWEEIKRNTRPGDTTRSDLKCRVFLTKAQEFLDDLFKRHIFGKVQAYHVVMEFQKRGMPHLHVLLIMENEISAEDVDNYISARLPEWPEDDNDTSDEAEQQREYYRMVMKHMLHICNANSACQVNGRCTKGYAKPFSTTTILHTHKPPDYQRLKPKSALDETPSETEKVANLSSPKKDPPKCDDDDGFMEAMEEVGEIKNENFDAKADDEWEEELPFYDELRKDYDEDLTHVQYKRLEPPPDGAEITEETKHLFGFTATKKVKGRPDVIVDDSVVVPHNKFLLLKYDCHINVECTIGQTGSPKYTCKYVTKMGDVLCAKLQKFKHNKETGEDEYEFDEGERHLTAKVMTGCEAWMKSANCWIIKQSHIVECLQIHLEGENTKVFQPGFEAHAASKEDKSQLIAYFKLCAKYKEAQQYTYREIPLHYRYKNGEWLKRKLKPKKFFVRVHHVPPNNAELYALRMLLMTVKGPKSFQDIKKVGDVQCNTFLEAAQKLGLWESDEIHKKAIQEAFIQMRNMKQKRFFFAMVIAYNRPGTPDQFLEDFLDHIFDSPGQDPKKNREQRRQRALRYLEYVFQTMGTSCRTLGFSVGTNFEKDCTSKEFEEDYNDIQSEYIVNKKVVDIKEYVEHVKENGLNGDQQVAFAQIEEALKSKKGGFYSLIGGGGVGKTFFYNYLILYCKAYGFKPMVSASTGIAATLLNGGQTAHSAFCIPKSMDAETPVRINGQTTRGVQLQETDIIILDECSMLHKNVLQYIDKTMQDMKDSKELFGGAIVLIGGDWKQLTPVVPGGSDEAIIDASIKNWDQYDQCVQLELKENMRVKDELDFVNELNLIGNGDAVNYSNYIKGTNYIKIDPEYLAPNGRALMDFCYEPQWLQEPEKYANELCGSAILCPRNETVRNMNQTILDNLRGSKQKTFLSRNTPLGDQPINALQHDANEYSVEKMEGIETAGMPPHVLNLKKGAIVMLIKNISVSTGLCNGTRMQVTDIYDEYIKCKVLSGSRSGSENEIYLPRCKFEYGNTPSEPGIHFSRCQFPVKLAFSMTINKAQGQTLDRVGLLFRGKGGGDCFSHGQLYTAMSRSCLYPSLEKNVAPQFYVSVTRTVTYFLAKVRTAIDVKLEIGEEIDDDFLASVCCTVGKFAESILEIIKIDDKFVTANEQIVTSAIEMLTDFYITLNRIAQQFKAKMIAKIDIHNWQSLDDFDRIVCEMTDPIVKESANKLGRGQYTEQQTKSSKSTKSDDAKKAKDKADKQQQDFVRRNKKDEKLFVRLDKEFETFHGTLIMIEEKYGSEDRALTLQSVDEKDMRTFKFHGSALAQKIAKDDESEEGGEGSDDEENEKSDEEEEDDADKSDEESAKSDNSSESSEHDDY